MNSQREEIIVRAGFDNTALQSGMRTASQSVKNFANEIGRSILAAFSAGAIISQIESVFTRVKAIQAGAAKTGLNSTDYQKLSKVANDELPDGMEKFDSALTKLNVKIGEGAKDFGKWGISSRDTEAAMYEIADHMHAMQDPSERAAMAVDLMGRSGADMVPLLERGAKALKAMADEKPAWSPDDLKAIAEAHKNIDNAKDNVTMGTGWLLGLYMQLTTALAQSPLGLEPVAMTERAMRERVAQAKRLTLEATIRQEFADMYTQSLTDQYNVEMDQLDAGIEAQEAAQKKAKAEKDALEFLKRSSELLREHARLSHEISGMDQETPGMSDLAGTRFTNRLNRLYGSGGRFDLGAGNGPFAKIAQQYELAQKQQLWDIIHGNAVFNGQGDLIGGAAYGDKQRMIGAHNLLAGAGLDTPNMKLKDIRQSLLVVNKQLDALNALAAGQGINIKIPSD